MHQLDARPLTMDYRDEIKLHSSAVVRTVLAILGTISLLLGIAGVFLPLLPTTPFLLLTAILYARSSGRFYSWLLGNRVVGPYIHEWRTTRSISLKHKITAIVLLVLTVGSSVIWFIPLLAVKIVVAAIGFGVLIFLLRIPTLKRSRSQD